MFLKHNIVDKLISSNNSFKSRYIDLMKYELLKNLYHNGEHFSNPNIVKNKFHNIIYDSVIYLIIKFFQFTIKSRKKYKILSSAASTWNNEIKKAGYNSRRPPWNLNKDLRIDTNYEIFLLCRKIDHCFKYKSFNYLVSDKFILLLDEFYNKYKNFCRNKQYRCLVVSEYNSFFSKVALSIFRDLSKPSIFLHHGGVPTFYEKNIQNRCDYFVMWGKKQINSYSKMGYNKNKFYVSGHPSYTEIPKKLKFGLNNILVINKSLLGVHPMEKFPNEDKGNAIIYLYSLQNVLKKMGVENVKLKVHPSENFNWYKKYIDSNFFQRAGDNINKCLDKADLVIGPASTTIIDSLFNGVNYVIYEPKIKNKSILGWDITPPIDGKDPRIPVAFNEDELINILKNKLKIEISILNEFVKQPLDLTFFDKIIK